MSENISPGRHMMTGTIRIFLAEALILPTGFITAVFLARSLGPVGYGPVRPCLKVDHLDRFDDPISLIIHDLSLSSRRGYKRN